MLLRDKLFIGGAWVAPSGKETIDVHNAGTGEVMGTRARRRREGHRRRGRRGARRVRWLERDAGREARRVPARRSPPA